MTMGPARTTPLPRDPDRLDEALPWYLNGTLDEADRAWVEQALRDDRSGESAELLRSLEFDRRTAESLEQRLAEIPADVGWAELIRKVREDVAPEPAAARRRGAGAPAAGGTWRERIARFVAPLMSPQLGMAMAALVVAQAVVIGALVGREGSGPDTLEYRSGAGATEIVAIRALLDETVTEKALREALQANGATIIDGPDPLGQYWIVTGKRDPEAVAAALREAGVVASYVIDRRVQGR
jgi:hypothetical protein